MPPFPLLPSSPFLPSPVHPWINYPATEKVPLDFAIFKSIRNFLSISSLRRASLKSLASTLTDDDPHMRYLRQQFGHIDADGDGKISYSDLKSVRRIILKPLSIVL